MKKRIERLMQSSPVAQHFIYFLIEINVAIVSQISSAKCRRKYKNENGLKINFGSGSILKKGFLNLDFSSAADVRLDLRKPIPLNDSCANLVYSEHFVEHLTYPEGVDLHFSECFRLLESRGEISISVPDTEWPLVEYVEKKTSYLDACELHNWHPEDCTTFMEHINYHFRQRWVGRSYSHFENHRFAWDFETMKKKLKQFGFVDIALRDFDPNLDSNHRKPGSLFVHAFKPAN